MSEDARSPYKVRMREQSCPWCGGDIGASTCLSVDEEIVPEAGSWSVCIHCVQVCRYDAGLTLRRPHDGELEAVYLENPSFALEMRATQRVLRKLDRSDPDGIRPPPGPGFKLTKAEARLSFRTAMFCSKADNTLPRPYFGPRAREHFERFSEELLERWRLEARAMGIPDEAVAMSPRDEAFMEALLGKLGISDSAKAGG